jgi:uncharacterized membrane protein
VVLRIVRAGVALALLGSGALMYAASWQRWAGICPFGRDPDTQPCNSRMDHLYDFLPPAEPWADVGTAPELAGASLLVLAVAIALLPWALVARPWSPITRAGTVAALVVCTVALVDVAVAALRSGLDDTVVDPVSGNASTMVWLLALPLVLGWLAVRASGWSAVAMAFLVLGSPLVAAFSYAIGPYDANPWYEAVMGVFTAGAGACLLVVAGRRSPGAARGMPAQAPRAELHRSESPAE